MKIKHLIVAAVAVVVLAGCSQPKDYGWIKVAVDRATVQLLQTAEEIGDTPMIPRSIWAGYDPAMLEKQLEKDFDTFKDSLRKKAAPELLGKRRLAGVYDWQVSTTGPAVFTPARSGMSMSSPATRLSRRLP